MGASHLLDTLASIPPGIPLYIRDNRTENWGVAKSWNWGIRTALSHGAEYILVLNDDVRLDSPDFIDRLVADLERDHVILASGRPDHVEMSSSDKRPAMSAFMCDGRLFQEVGEFDEQFWPAYFEDDDMLHRIKASESWTTFFDNEAVFHHWVSSTIGELRNARKTSKTHFKQNRERFFKKWGYYPS